MSQPTNPPCEHVTFDLDTVPPRSVTLSLEASLTKPTSRSHAVTCIEFWQDVVSFAAALRTDGGASKRGYAVLDVTMSELELVPRAPKAAARLEGRPALLPRLELTVLITADGKDGAAHPRYPVPVSLEVMYSLGQPSALLHDANDDDGGHHDHRHSHGHDHDHGDDACCNHHHHHHDHGSEDVDGAEDEEDDETKSDADEQPIVVRPRITSTLYNGFFTEAGLIRADAAERAGDDAIELEDVQSAVATVRRLLTTESIPHHVMRQQLPSDDILLDSWAFHANGTCPDCFFAHAMPCTWEEFCQARHESAVDAETLLEELKSRFAREVQHEEEREMRGAAIRHARVSQAIVAYTPAVFTRTASVESAIPLFAQLAPLDPAWPWDRILDPAVSSAISPLLRRKLSGELTETSYRGEVVKALRPLRQQETANVFSFPCLRPDFCAALVAELRAYEANAAMPKFRPNSMNAYGVIVNEMGLQPFITALCRVLLFPLGCDALPRFAGGGSLDHTHSFVVEYGGGRDVALDMHIDDSEVTFSVNLFDTFEGSSLVICGLVGEANRRQQTLEYHHALGRVLIHAGRHRHGVKPIESGERANLIIWGRSSIHREGAPKHGSSKCDCCARHPDEALPDQVCLSRTWDPDYSLHAK